MIYLDNSATTKLDERVAAVMQPFLGERYGNASSIHSLGREVKVALEEARESVARSIGADPAEIVFTSGGTEANNYAITGAIFSELKKSNTFSDCSILTSPIEHHAVLEPVRFLEELGVSVINSSVDENGVINVGNIPKQLTLASLMYVNNEVGTINDLTKLVSDIKEAAPQALVHSDAMQAMGKIKFDVHDLGVDLLSISAHKIHGPKGIGALYIRRGVQIEPLLHGGSQERNRRGGTESAALAVGFGEAARLSRAEFNTRADHIKKLREDLLARLTLMPEVVINSLTSERCANSIVNISFVPGVLQRLDEEALIINLDLAGFAVSNGAACTSGTLQPSHVLLAMGKGEEVAAKSIRISFSKDNLMGDIELFVAALTKIIR